MEIAFYLALPEGAALLFVEMNYLWQKSLEKTAKPKLWSSHQHPGDPLRSPDSPLLN